MVGDRGRFLDRPAALVGADLPEARLLSVNPPARRDGLRPGMVIDLARRRSRRLELFTPRPDLIRRSSLEVCRALGDYSPLVEPAASGFFLDLTGTSRLLGPSTDVAARIMRECGDRFGLLSSAGLGACKLVGRAASSSAPAPGLARVMASQEADFLGGFPIRRLIPDKNLTARLAEMGIHRVRDLQPLSAAELAAAFGKSGPRLHQIANGIDHSPVLPPESLPEIDCGESLTEASNDRGLISGMLWGLCARMGADLRRRRMGAGAVRLLVVYRDGARALRRGVFKRPAAFDRDIHELALALLDNALIRRVQVVYIGLRATRLAASAQPDLFGEFEKKQGLYRAVDDIRERFGRGALSFGIELWPA